MSNSVKGAFENLNPNELRLRNIIFEYVYAKDTTHNGLHDLLTLTEALNNFNTDPTKYWVLTGVIEKEYIEPDKLLEIQHVLDLFEPTDFEDIDLYLSLAPDDGVALWQNANNYGVFHNAYDLGIRTLLVRKVILTKEGVQIVKDGFKKEVKNEFLVDIVETANSEYIEI